MAQELELKVDSAKYNQRISMLSGYVTQIEGLLDSYTALKNRVGDFMGNDDNVASAQAAADVGIQRCRKAISATNTNIKTLQDTVSNIIELGANVKTILEAAVEAASAGLLD